MKKFNLIVILSVILFSCASKDEGTKISEDSPQYEFAKALSKTLPAVDPDSNKVMVSTNQFNITTGSVINALYINFKTQLDQLKKLSSIRLKKIFLDNAKLLAEKKMLVDAASNEGIETSDAEIDSALQTEYTRHGSQEKYLEFLKNKNITLDFVKEDYANSIAIKKYLEREVKVLITITNEEIQQKLMDTKLVSVRHILLMTKDKSEQEKQQIKKKMEEIRKLALSGKDFAKLASKYTEDLGSKANGGLYANFGRGYMVQPFEEISFSLLIGEISEVFETEFGYHIVKVIDIKKETRSAEEIRTELEKQKSEKEFPLFVEQLKKKYDFTIIEL